MQRVNLFIVINCLALATVSCNQSGVICIGIADSATVASVEAAKVDGAVSCSVIGYP
jgi:hypothetical protein